MSGPVLSLGSRNRRPAYWLLALRFREDTKQLALFLFFSGLFATT